MKVAKAKKLHGFSRSDLAALVAVGSVLSLLPLQVVSSSSTTSDAIVCLSNVGKLTRAWVAYSEDHDGDLLSSTPTTVTTRTPWITGYMDFSMALPGYYQPIRQSPLFPYLNEDVRVWRCPSDLARIRDNKGRMMPRARSYSMNDAFGTGGWLPESVWRTYTKRESIVNPAKTWVFLDEHPDSINDGGMAVQMVRPQDRTARIIDFPASFHRRGASFSFADGHAEIHKWKGKRIQPEPRYNNSMALNVEAGDSLPDMKWLSEHTTVSKRTGSWE